MHRFNSRLIATKLRWIIAFATVPALALACVAPLVYDSHTFRTAKLADVTMLAEVLASNSTGALAFQDSRAASEVLQALNFIPHIEAAAIYDRSGTRFATYNPAGSHNILPLPTPLNNASYFLDSRTLVVFRDIVLDHDRVGTVYIRYDLAELGGRRAHFAKMMALVVPAALLLALLLGVLVAEVNHEANSKSCGRYSSILVRAQLFSRRSRK